MSLTAVIKKEFLDSIRSYMLLGLTALFVLFVAGFASLEFVPTGYQRNGPINPSTLALLNSLRTPTVFFIPLIGLVVGYNSIVGERESGKLRLMLSLPNTRSDVVFGKFLGRSAVIAVSILLGYIPAGVIALILYDSFAFGIFVTYTLLTIFYGVVYIAIATGISAGVKTRGGGIAAAGVIYTLFLIIWDVFVAIFAVATGGFSPEITLPGWIQTIFMLNPSTAFAYATREAIPEFDSIVVLPYHYFQDWVGFVFLALWIVVPLGLGYFRFNNIDL
jgi:ABC-2 type transport system permease protein